MTEIYECPHCHHSSNQYWHRITPGLVSALVKFKRAVIYYDRNSIHIRKDMENMPFELTRLEWNNFTKLRFHGLAVQDVRAGYWLLTRRGAEFLRGQVSIPCRVKTMNNHIIERDNVFVTIEDIVGETPYFEDIKTIEQDRVAVSPQLSLLEAV